MAYDSFGVVVVEVKAQPSDLFRRGCSLEVIEGDQQAERG